MVKNDCIEEGKEMKEKGNTLIASYCFFAAKEYEALLEILENYEGSAPKKIFYLRKVFRNRVLRAVVHRVLFKKESIITNKMLKKGATSKIKKELINYSKNKRYDTDLFKVISWYVSQDTSGFLKIRKHLHKND
ncbi:MAG: hypothetical protein R6U26_00780 [Candidatus Undinarchaeales archaeon]